MAIYNELLAARYGRFLQKLFSMKGGTPAKALAGDIASTIAFFQGAENRFTEEWTLAAGYADVAAIAANISGARLFNPLGSNVVAVVSSILALNLTAADVPVLTWQGGGGAASPVGPFAAGAVGTVVSLDNRTGSNNANTPARTSLQISFKNNNPTTFGTPIRRIGGAQNVGNEFLTSFDAVEIPLAPDTALDVYSGNVNNRIVFSFLWRERILEASELK